MSTIWRVLLGELDLMAGIWTGWRATWFWRGEDGKVRLCKGGRGESVVYRQMFGPTDSERARKGAISPFGKCDDVGLSHSIDCE
ncbi:hypothetical protein J0A71_06g12470 [Encephalitozoon cuniculi]|nr:hypothetical protein J0A71_01g02460 [Encephalitozoon cuniculi]UYI26455.1 hypothetical protein J0A71_02g02800 [Encephalitozoon cuniculi]UYI27354.1 hypothetical protein J0A71_05g12170 [Encephalitozoon cuniculi]UYI27380.1 hypothetical protein J0A71_06g12470 [Encephalitozoon cuniculi]